MKPSTKTVIRKKRGRPATGQDPITALRLPADLLKAVDKWAAKHGINRSVAIRQWIEVGLQAPTPQRSKSADLAARAIDQLADPLSSAEDQASRKRRLLKGPKEFRDLRGDAPSKSKG